MPSASLFVGHGGHGTTMQALAHDLPMLVMPMDRLADQPTVGRSLAEAGAGRVVAKSASVDGVAPLVAGLLADGPHRTAAARLGAAVRAMPGATLGADALEELLRDAAPAPGRRARLDPDVVEPEPPGEHPQLGAQLVGGVLRGAPSSAHADFTSSVPLARSALRSTRATISSPSRNGRT